MSHAREEDAPLLGALPVEPAGQEKNARDG